MNLKKWVGSFLDSSVIFSFDKTGYNRHCPDPLKTVDLSGTHGIITGASSGIGLAAAQTLSGMGMDCLLVGRNRDKVDPSKRQNFHVVDMGNLKKVLAFSKTAVNKSINLLIHNAGGMPAALHITQEGFEEMFASQVLGPYILTRSLLDQGKLQKGSRIIFVSSGGMYLQKLDLSDLTFKKGSYNKYRGYANAKRGQVILSELFSKKYPEYLFSAMHPGWVDTPGVRTSMPTFRKLINTNLRTPEQGADTLIWLATTPNYKNGTFWFDRKEAKTNIFNLYSSTEVEKELLWNTCESIYKSVSSS